MKGSPDSPKCGYSKLMVEIIKFYELENYKYINVLDNAVIRK
jgi:glutaredoxin-related protein